MAVPRPLVSLGKAALVAALVLPPTALWLSGRLGEDAGRELQPPASSPLATMPRTETTAAPASRAPAAADAPPAPAPSVTVGPGAVSVPPPVPGAAPLPPARSGTVVDDPLTMPGTNR